MDSTRQLLRWSVPGFVFVLTFFLLQAVWIVVIEQRSILSAVAGANAAGLLAIVAGGIPLGFLIYQIYYWRFAGVGGMSTGSFFRNDRGGKVLTLYLFKYNGNRAVLEWIDAKNHDPAVKHSPVLHKVEPLDDRLCAVDSLTRKFWILQKPRRHLCDTPGPPKPLPDRCPNCRRIWSRRFSQNWTLFQSAVDYCSATETRRWIKHEYTVGSDIYHALGASRTAAVLAALGVVVYDTVLVGRLNFDYSLPNVWTNNRLGLLVVWFTWCAFTAAQYLLFRRSRDNVSKDYEERIAAGLAFVSFDLNPKG